MELANLYHSGSHYKKFPCGDSCFDVDDNLDPQGDLSKIDPLEDGAPGTAQNSGPPQLLRSYLNLIEKLFATIFAGTTTPSPNPGPQTPEDDSTNYGLAIDSDPEEPESDPQHGVFRIATPEHLHQPDELESDPQDGVFVIASPEDLDQLYALGDSEEPKNTPQTSMEGEINAPNQGEITPNSVQEGSLKTTFKWSTLLSSALNGIATIIRNIWQELLIRLHIIPNPNDDPSYCNQFEDQ